MNARAMDFLNQHAGTIGFGGFGLGFITSFNSALQAGVLICTLIITAPKAVNKLVGWYGEYWPKLVALVNRVLS